MGVIEDGIEYVDQIEGAQIIDRLAHKYLGMSGLEFVMRFRNGEIENYDGCDTNMGSVSMLLPLIGESSVYGKYAQDHA